LVSGRVKQANEPEILSLMVSMSATYHI